MAHNPIMRRWWRGLVDSADSQRTAGQTLKWDTVADQLRRIDLSNQRGRLHLTKEHFIRLYASLLFSENFSDLVFVCGPDGERIHAHRCIVAANLPFNLRMGPWDETSQEGDSVLVKLSQSAEAVRALLRFMYMGDVSCSCPSVAKDVLDLAVQHEQPELKAACEARIAESISAQAVDPALEAAQTQRSEAHVESIAVESVITEEKQVTSGTMGADQDPPAMLDIDQTSELTKIDNHVNGYIWNCMCAYDSEDETDSENELGDSWDGYRYNVGGYGGNVKICHPIYQEYDPRYATSLQVHSARLVQCKDLTHSAMAGSKTSIKALLREGVSVETVDVEGSSALMWGARFGHIDVVKLLVANGASIHVRNDSGDTALHCAAFHDNLAVCLFLLSLGADPTEENNFKRTALTHYGAGKNPPNTNTLPEPQGLLSRNIIMVSEFRNERVFWGDVDVEVIMVSDDTCEYAEHSPNNDCDYYDNINGICYKTHLSSIDNDDWIGPNRYELCMRYRKKTPSSEAALSRRCAALKEAVWALQHPMHINASLLFSDTFSDLVFVCPGGERIHAHRCIVSACSPFMLIMLQGRWAENVGPVSEVKMPQSAASVSALLRLFYTGDIDAEACTYDTMDVLDLAVQHEQPELKAACEVIAAESINIQSVGPIIAGAYRHDLMALLDECIDFVAQNGLALLFEPSFQELQSEPALWNELKTSMGCGDLGQRKRARRA